MRVSSNSVKAGSRRSWRIVLGGLGAFALLVGASGCFVSGDDEVVTAPPAGQGPGMAAQQPVAAAIDVNQTISADPGKGTGVFVEYAAGGHWRIWTTCDTLKTGQVCPFDITATTADGSRLTNVQTEGLEGGGSVRVSGASDVELVTETGAGVDAVTFDAVPGTTVEVGYRLEGVGFDPHFFFWIGDGVLHQGAPTDPLDLIPSAK